MSKDVAISAATESSSAEESADPPSSDDDDPAERRAGDACGIDSGIADQIEIVDDVPGGAGVDAAWLRERLIECCAEIARPINRIGVALVDEARMRELNLRHLREDSATDVLSFDFSESEGNGRGAEVQRDRGTEQKGERRRDEETKRQSVWQFPASFTASLRLFVSPSLGPLLPFAPLPLRPFGHCQPPTAGDPIEAEIIVSIGAARRRAKELGHAVERELLLYALHGLLHCAGYDDRSPEDFKIMHAEEDRILEGIGVGRTFDARSTTLPVVNPGSTTLPVVNPLSERGGTFDACAQPGHGGVRGQLVRGTDGGK